MAKEHFGPHPNQMNLSEFQFGLFLLPVFACLTSFFSPVLAFLPSKTLDIPQLHPILQDVLYTPKFPGFLQSTCLADLILDLKSGTV